MAAVERWGPYGYVYLLGGLVWLVGLAVAWRRGARPGRLGLLLVGGLVAYAVGHALLQLAGTPGPHPAAGEARGASGYVGAPVDVAVVGIYFVVILGAGAYFARFTRTTGDFFFGGRRFSAWLVAVSCVATTVGAYSFVKYSSAGFRFGLSSSMTYLNDWFWMPLWMLVWLPVIYYGRIQSVPEYFERRFGPIARLAATVILLVYLVGYVGINFLTLGKALHALTGWPVVAAAGLAAAATGVYVAVGGQTSVIMTDLLQGLILLAVGLGLVGAGIAHLGGFEVFWAALPEAHRLGFAALDEPAAFNTRGIFWQDAMAGGVAFYFINQGILMRFLAARSVKEGRRAMALVVLLVMPLAAVAVSGAGWVGRSMVTVGMLPGDTDPDNVFVLVSAVLASPGVFGLVMATLTAALMSTADTLLTAISAVFVNDVWRPYLRRDADDGAALRTARWATVAAATLGLVLVPAFAAFESIYLAHATFVAAVVPPMAVALVLGVLWPRFGPRAAVLTLVGGTALVAASVIWPELVAPFAGEAGPGGEGLKAYKYLRAFYGLAVSTGLGVLGALVLDRRAAPPSPLLVAGPEDAARAAFKGSAAKAAGRRIRLRLMPQPFEVRLAGGDEPLVTLSPDDAGSLGAAAGDLVHVAAPGWWHGGLRSFHARVDHRSDARPGELLIPQALLRPSGLTPEMVVVVTLEG